MKKSSIGGYLDYLWESGGSRATFKGVGECGSLFGGSLTVPKKQGIFTLLSFVIVFAPQKSIIWSIEQLQNINLLIFSTFASNLTQANEL